MHKNSATVPQNGIARSAYYLPEPSSNSSVGTHACSNLRGQLPESVSLYLRREFDLLGNFIAR